MLDGGVDLLLVETCQDMLNVKAAYLGITSAFEKLKTEVPIMISGTIEPMGTTLAGQRYRIILLITGTHEASFSRTKLCDRP